jgi:hypothetical protein
MKVVFAIMKRYMPGVGRRLPEPTMVKDEMSRLYQGVPEADRGSGHESEAGL